MKMDGFESSQELGITKKFTRFQKTLFFNDYLPKLEVFSYFKNKSILQIILKLLSDSSDQRGMWLILCGLPSKRNIAVTFRIRSIQIAE